jgi:hypothetical protein
MIIFASVLPTCLGKAQGHACFFLSRYMNQPMFRYESYQTDRGGNAGC